MDNNKMSTCRKVLIRLEQLVYFSAFGLFLGFIFYFHLAPDNLVYVSWDWFTPRYGAASATTFPMYMTASLSPNNMTVNTFYWFTLFLYPYLATWYFIVTFLSPSSVFYSLSRISLPAMNKPVPNKAGSSVQGLMGYNTANSLVTTIVKHYCDDSYGFVYLFVARAVAYPLLFSMCFYLLGQQTGAVLYSIMGAAEFYNIVLFSAAFAVNSIRMVMEHNEQQRLKVGDTERTSAVWLSSPLQTSIPIFLVVFWILLLVVICHPMRIIIQNSTIPAGIYWTEIVLIVELALTSTSFLVDVFIILFHAGWGPEPFFGVPFVREKMYLFNIVCHMYGMFLYTFAFASVRDYIVAHTNGPVVL